MFKHSRIAGAFLALACLMAFVLGDAPDAQAASSYNIVETTGTVGTQATFEFEYTVDTAQQTWATGDTLTIAIPLNFSGVSLSLSAEYDTDVNNDGVGETAITSGPGNGQYALTGGGSLVTIKWNSIAWGAVVNGSSTIRVLLTATPTFENATSNFVFGGSTADVGDTNPSGTDSVNVSAADAAASVTLASNSTVGVGGFTVLNVNLAARLTANDTVVFTLPSHLNLNSLAFSSENFTGAGTFSDCTAVGQVVTCTANGIVGPGVGNIVLSGVIAKWVATGQTVTSVAVNDNDQAGADIARDASGTVTDTTVGNLTNTDVQPLVTTRQYETPNRVVFTTHAAIPADGKILITYPNGWNIAAANGMTASELSGINGTLTIGVVGQVLTLTRTGGTAALPGIVAFTVPKITTPNQYEGGVYQLLTRTSSDQDIETDTSVSSDYFSEGSRGPGSKPGEVTGLTITDNAAGGVLITWVDPSSTGDFNIDLYRKIYPGSETASYITSVRKGVMQYSDTEVSSGQTVSYIARATNKFGASAFTAEFIFVAGSTMNEGGEETEEENSLVPEADTSEEVVSEPEEVEEPDETEEESTVTEPEVVLGAFDSLVEVGVIQGNADGDYAKDSLLNKAEAAALFYRILSDEPAHFESTPFEDVLGSEWYASYISELYQSELLVKSGSYEPATAITREDFFSLLEGVVDHLGIEDGNICQRQICIGQGTLSREEAADILYEVFAEKL